MSTTLPIFRPDLSDAAWRCVTTLRSRGTTDAVSAQRLFSSIEYRDLLSVRDRVGILIAIKQDAAPTPQLSEAAQRCIAHLRALDISDAVTADVIMSAADLSPRDRVDVVMSFRRPQRPPPVPRNVDGYSIAGQTRSAR